MTGLEEFHREITAKKYGYLRRCVEVIDPFGNRIRFDETLANAAEKPA